MNIRVRLGGVFICLAIVAAPLGLMAAEPPVLDLPELVKLALEYSPQVKASQSEVEAAKQQHEQAKSHYYPQVEAVAITGVAPNTRRPEVRGNQIYFPDPSNRIHGVSWFGRIDAHVFQPLYTFGKIAYRKRAASHNVQVKKSQVEEKKGDVIWDLAQAYYGLILAQQGVAEVKDARVYLDDIRQRINRLLQVGSPAVQESDRYRLDMFEGAVDKFAAEAEEGAKVAYKALKALIGYGPDQNFRVPLELPQPSAAPQPLEHYIQKALDLRPEFTQLKEGLEARKLLVEAAKADRWPSLFLGLKGAYAGAPGRQTWHNPYNEDYFNTSYVFPYLGMHMHLDFGITKAKIGQAQAELHQLENLQDTALMGIPVQVAQAYGKVSENYKKTVGLDKAYVNARRWLVTEISNFDMGIGQMDNIFDAFESFGTYRGDYLLALYNYHLATVEMDKATGLYQVRLPAAAKGQGK
ncbi:MAG: TolC family protein [Desulfobacteraceae bacterium]